MVWLSFNQPDTECVCSVRDMVTGRKMVRIVPSGFEMKKITRYEAHLERSLYRALHELQRLQVGRGDSQLRRLEGVDA